MGTHTQTHTQMKSKGLDKCQMKCGYIQAGGTERARPTSEWSSISQSRSDPELPGAIGLFPSAAP